MSTRQPAWGNSSSLIKLLSRESSRRGLRRRGRGTCGEDKVPVSAFIERGGRMLITAAKDVTEETILALAKPRIKPGSIAYTLHLPQDSQRHVQA